MCTSISTATFTFKVDVSMIVKKIRNLKSMVNEIV